MKILLISTNTMTDPYPTYPIGLDYVAHAIGAGHQVQIADMNEVADDEALVAILVREQPDLIGLSIRNIDTTDSIHVKGFAESIGELIRLIRNHTQAKVVLGGSGFTILPEEWMRCLDADFGVIGEGERLPLLLEALEAIAVNACEAYDRRATEKNVSCEVSRTDDPDHPYQIRIADQGDGIPVDTHPHVFSPFYSTKTKHIGMGLTFARRIVEEQMGRITIDSVAGRGTVVTCHLIKERRRAIRIALL